MQDKAASNKQVRRGKHVICQVELSVCEVDGRWSAAHTVASVAYVIVGTCRPFFLEVLLRSIRSSSIRSAPHVPGSACFCYPIDIGFGFAYE